MLEDCQEEIREKAKLLSCCHLIDPSAAKAPQTHFEEWIGEHPTKAVVSGKLAANASSKSMCDQPVDEFVPIDSLVAFFDALRTANGDDLGVLHAEIVKLIRQILEDERLEHGAHAMRTPIENWFTAVTQLVTKTREFLDKLAQDPPLHYDGACSLVHASVTFFDHRLVKLWTEDPAEDENNKEIVLAWRLGADACVHHPERARHVLHRELDGGGASGFSLHEDTEARYIGVRREAFWCERPVPHDALPGRPACAVTPLAGYASRGLESNHAGSDRLGGPRQFSFADLRRVRRGAFSASGKRTTRGWQETNQP